MVENCISILLEAKKKEIQQRCRLQQQEKVRANYY